MKEQILERVNNTIGAIDFKRLADNGIEKGDEYAFTFTYPPVNCLHLLNEEDTKKRTINHDSINLYLHIPYCTGKCPFCYFQKVVDNSKAEVSKDEYIDLMHKEIKIIKRNLNLPEVATLNFGGGTPTCFTEDQMKRLFDILHKEFNIVKDPEISFECSIETLNAKKLKVMKELGINRITIGIQSLNERILKYIKRRYSLEKLEETLNLIRESGFDNVNGDFMYGLPTQTIDEWYETLEKAMKYNFESISFYRLRHHPKLEISNFHRDLFPSNEDTIKMQLLAKDFLSQNGYYFASSHKYVSNSDKVLVQIRNKRGVNGNTLVGLGCSSYGFIGDQLYWNVRNVLQYKEMVENGLHPVWIGEDLSEDDLRRKSMILGLHLPEGINRIDFIERFKYYPEHFYGDKLENLESLGLINRTEEYISLSSLGQIFADEVATQFYSDEVKKDLEKKGMKYGMFFQLSDYNSDREFEVIT